MMIIPNFSKVIIREIHDDWEKSLSLAKPGEAVKVKFFSRSFEEIILY